MSGPEKCPRPTQSPGWPVSAEYENFLQPFPQNKLSEAEKNASAIFSSRPRLKFELTRENGRNTSNTGSKSYVWQLVRIFYGIASKTEMLSVEAVWVMPSLTACHILSTPIRKANPNISDGGTSPYTFAASFNGEKLEEKTMYSAKKSVQSFSWLITICQSHDKNQEDRVREN